MLSPSPHLHRRYTIVRRVAPTVRTLTRGVGGVVFSGNNYNLTTPRVNRLVRLIAVSYSCDSGGSCSPCILVGPIVIRRDSRLIPFDRNYLSVPNVDYRVRHPSRIIIRTCSLSTGLVHCRTANSLFYIYLRRRVSRLRNGAVFRQLGPVRHVGTIGRCRSTLTHNTQPNRAR